MQNHKNLSDEELVTKVIKEDKEIFEELVNRYQDKLMRYATYLTKNEEKAADIVQESFIKTYVNLKGFNKNKKFSSWIYRIVHNETMNAIKKYHKEIPIALNIDFSSNENLEDTFSKKEIIEMAQKCLSKMDNKYSEPLILFYIEEKSYEEISDILRLPMGTVAIRISRAKAQMKNICQKK